MPAFATSTSMAEGLDGPRDRLASATSPRESPVRDTGRPCSRAARTSATAAPMPRHAPVTSTRVRGPAPWRRGIYWGARMEDVARRGHRRRGGVPADHVLAAGGGPPITGANMARAMQVSPPTVHEMIGRLEADGYVTRASDKALAFTDDGREQATQIVRRHRLIERFLTDVFDIPWDQVHEEAERLEHWMSPVVEERMLRAIGDAKTCPHGHPIFEGEREQGVPLADVEEGARVRVLRFENEAEDLLHYLKDTGLHPGLEGTLDLAGEDEVVLEAAGTSALGHPQRRRDRLGGGRPLAAAAHGPARSAGAGPRALRALTEAPSRGGATTPSRRRLPAGAGGGAPACGRVGLIARSVRLGRRWRVGRRRPDGLLLVRPPAAVGDPRGCQHAEEEADLAAEVDRALGRGRGRPAPGCRSGGTVRAAGRCRPPRGSAGTRACRPAASRSPAPPALRSRRAQRGTGGCR